MKQIFLWKHLRKKIKVFHCILFEDKFSQIEIKKKLIGQDAAVEISRNVIKKAIAVDLEDTPQLQNRFRISIEAPNKVVFECHTEDTLSKSEWINAFTKTFKPSSN